MASPPPFDLCGDLDDDDIDEPVTAVPKDRHLPAAAPTPNGLNDHLLRFTRSLQRPTQNPNPSPNPPPPPPPAAAEEQVEKVKLAGRRRLCKLATTTTATQRVDEEEAEWDNQDDGESILDILDDLTTRFDSLSVQKPSTAARSRTQQLTPLPCAITVDDDLDDHSPDDVDAHAGASSPLQISSSDEARAPTRRSEVKIETDLVSSACTHYACDDVRGKGKNKGTTKDVGRLNRVSKASSFVDSYSDSDYDDCEEDQGTRTDYAVKQLRSKGFTRRPPNTPTFRNHGVSDDELGQEKENLGAVENNAEDVGWEKTEDFKMDPTGTAATSKPYKLPGKIFKMLFAHQREGLRWLWVLHCRGTGGILGDDMGLGKTMQVAAFLAGLFHSRLVKRVLIVAPKTLLAHWTKELSIVGLKEKIRDYSGPSTNIRNYELQYAFKEGGILITTYDIVRNNYKLIRGNSYNNSNDDDDEEGTLWNYVILDEGHLIKNNKTQRAQSLYEIPCAHRIVISGTPIQNNLKVSIIPFLNSCNFVFYVLYYMFCMHCKPYYHCRKCGLCSISVAQMSWVINSSNTIQSITLYFLCTLKVA
ncbi:Protein CHROMATIN REMODELING 24 [Zea mays]|uniref:Protein CHROMATIN REMODELING 24 n=1 Tax=Zea mays TaxID=4577 RepID=A0A1D6E5N1_MAIZE|nr:Protein CHROMATIN REMODELING 24 [Zea mays]